MAITLDQIHTRVSAYLAEHPEEQPRLAVFTDAIAEAIAVAGTEASADASPDASTDASTSTSTSSLASTETASDGGRLTARSTLPGHVTTGAFLLDADDRILQIAHKALSRWLNPGGHVETEDEDLPAAALRELTEETGIPAEHIRLLTAEPFDIDVHRIPANAAKGEPEHWHYDLRYVFRLIGDGAVDLQAEEVEGHRWIEIAALGDSVSDRTVGAKLPRLLRGEQS